MNIGARADAGVNLNVIHFVRKIQPSVRITSPLLLSNPPRLRNNILNLRSFVSLGRLSVHTKNFVLLIQLNAALLLLILQSQPRTLPQRSNPKKKQAQMVRFVGIVTETEDTIAGEHARTTKEHIPITAILQQRRITIVQGNGVMGYGKT